MPQCAQDGDGPGAHWHTVKLMEPALVRRIA